MKCELFHFLDGMVFHTKNLDLSENDVDDGDEETQIKTNTSAIAFPLQVQRRKY